MCRSHGAQVVGADRVMECRGHSAQDVRTGGLNVGSARRNGVGIYASKHILSALSYTAISEGGFSSDQRLLQRFQATCRRPVSELLQEQVLVFPAKLE